MAFSAKVCLVAGAGCITSVAIGLSQARSSLSIKERLALDGYVLISSKDEKITTKAWENRASIYRDTSKNSSVLLSDLPHTNVNEKGDELKAKCDKFTDGKTTMNSIDKDIYEKITKLCALKIKEYIQSHLNKEDKFIEKQGQDEEWNNKFKEHKDRMSTEIEGINEDNAKEKISEYCEKVYELQQSNTNSSTSSNANYWCVKRPASPTKPTDSDSED
ncbi:hypothetical protein A6V39_04090 [Candidatus Mycoplasma haematobovis]|uniref:Uncharacterized protein n=1 Tax=Candidatus Mycoplasma haematobovis TaxID=432608 RepID=A0A1A9QED6_9MOLU|nr:hypothetical protein [Candidatus Mycoplasma haematobovis]OAL10069.1 hypothetical protein A6V39_04090 [Candidatus Mycoplasma haematobovis]